jgi:hypothetical protein
VEVEVAEPEVAAAESADDAGAEDTEQA